MDKATLCLLEALKRALASVEEQRLFRSGKLPGLFSTRTGTNGEAAQKALADGLLEVVHSETRGARLVQWVRPTAKAIDFIHEHESPAIALNELRIALQSTNENYPLWLAEIRTQVEELAQKLISEVTDTLKQLDALCQRVNSAIERIEAATPRLPEAITEAVPWARTGIDFLNRRKETKAEPTCPLSELFAALRESCPNLTIAEFHQGLRRMAQHGIIQLSVAPDAASLAEPEYALLDGITTYSYVSANAA